MTKLPSRAKTIDRHYIYDLIINNRLTVRRARRRNPSFDICTKLRLFIIRMTWGHAAARTAKSGLAKRAGTTTGKNEPLLTERQTHGRFQVSFFTGGVFARDLDATVHKFNYFHAVERNVGRHYD